MPDTAQAGAPALPHLHRNLHGDWRVRAAIDLVSGQLYLAVIGVTDHQTETQIVPSSIRAAPCP